MNTGVVLARVEERDYQSKVARAEESKSRRPGGRRQGAQRPDARRSAVQGYALISPTYRRRTGRLSVGGSRRALGLRADLDVAATALRDTTLRAPRSGVACRAGRSRCSACPARDGRVHDRRGGTRRKVGSKFDAVVRQLRPGLSLTASADAVVERTFTAR